MDKSIPQSHQLVVYVYKNVTGSSPSPQPATPEQPTAAHSRGSAAMRHKSALSMSFAGCMAGREGSGKVRGLNADGPAVAALPSWVSPCLRATGLTLNQVIM